MSAIAVDNLQEEIDIELAKLTIERARDWIDYCRREGRFDPQAQRGTFVGIIFGDRLPEPAPVPPVGPPGPDELAQAIAFLKERGIEV